ncbi:rhomboid family intramembrane serine protease [Streptomyces sp. SID5785]|uniref:rhomboid family intramembrane serine protease n=1 Tax=Streptomyces sp. SID5785 TaxID=2690309 RepID=UPI001360EAC8|nr:rhomboid family intramembrane serine protease [Streptomyces sp. SID5785]MZD10021.1 rhomboid family intramembrane serine protease [Streptomyces sp. SID5785]
MTYESSQNTVTRWSPRERIVPAAKVMAGWLALLWLLEAVDTVSGHSLDRFGVQPREASELVDVVPSAFVHFGFGHLAANSLPLLVLGFVAALSGLRRFLYAVAIIAVAGGLGVWLVAPAHTNTAGASGIIFGLFGFVLLSGFVERRPLGIVVGILVAAYYGAGILGGLSPLQEGVSWQGHLLGLAAGIAAAFALRRRGDAAHQ